VLLQLAARGAQPGTADMSATQKKRPSSIGEKLFGWSIACLGFLVVAYFAWLRLPIALWQWANEAWWHWIVAIGAYPLLFIAPIPLAVVTASPLLIAMVGPATRSHLWWEAVSYLGAIGLGVLILWAFTPAPEWWAHQYWWLWWAAVAGSAAVSAGGRMFVLVYEVDTHKVRDTYSREWKFNHSCHSSPPALGIAMSGGGIRSAAFNIGVLCALHDKGILRSVDLMSAVSGGSYAMSWYLLQPFYTATVAKREHRDFKFDDVMDEMFRADGRFQTYLSRDPRVVDRLHTAISAVKDVALDPPLRAMWGVLGIVGLYNGLGGFRKKYRERLQRLFQGLPSPDSKNEIENEIDWRARHELLADTSDFFDVVPVSYPELAEFAQQNRLPYFIFNATVLVQRACRHLLWPTAFEFTAYDVGSDVCGYRTWDDLKQWEVAEHISQGMSPSRWLDRLQQNPDKWELRRHRWVLMVNLASAISGAAIGLSYFNPKKTSLEMKLATWTPFFGNLDLGYILYREIWNEKGALYVSDGGHCENLGAYALIKRQCGRIMIVDAEHEAAVPYVFAAYTKLKQQLAQEMQLVLVVSDIDSYLDSAKGTSKPTGPSAEVMTGEVKPITSGASARLAVIYIKLGLDRNRLDFYPKHVSEYARKNSQFPQDPTSNQSFTSEQFIAYRDLGRHVACNLDQTIGAMMT
jgi:hypothetical protein